MRRLWGILACWLVAGPAFADGLAVWPSPRAVVPAGDGSLAFELVVVNATAETAREVVLTDALAGGARLLAASPAPRVEGGLLSWSLGDLPPSGVARVRLVVAGGTDAGARVHATLGGTARGAAALPVVALADEGLRPFLAPTADADAADPEVLAAVSALGGDPEAIMTRVTSLGYHAYRGSLRGARGTLWTGAGNALDRASLLVALLRAAGHPARYASGALPPEEAAALVRAMFPPVTRALSAPPPAEALVTAALDPEGLGAMLDPETFASIVAAGPDGVRAAMFPDPAADPALLDAAGEHDWVEVYRDGAWHAVDPTGRGLPAPAEAERRSEVEPGRRHMATFVVRSERWSSLFGAILPRAEEEHLRVTVPVVEMVGRPVALGHEVDTDARPGPLFSVTTHTYRPVLRVDGRPRAEGPPWQEVVSNFPGGSLLVLGLFLDVTVESPGAAPIHTRHPLLDRVGAARRAGAEAEVQVPVDDGAPGIADGDVTTLHFAAGVTPARVVAGMRPLLEETRATLAAILPRAEALRDREPGALDAADRRFAAEGRRLAVIANHQVAETLGLRLLFQSDRMAEAIAEGTGVLAYPDRPRLAVVNARFSGDGAAPSIDLAIDRLRAISPPGVGRAAANTFRAAWGLAQARLEGLVLAEWTGRAPVVAFDTVLEAAAAQDVPVRFVGEDDLRTLQRAGMSADARALVARAVRAGRWVLTPEREVAIDGRPHLVWLEVDPATGESISVDARGHRPALVEYPGILSYTSSYGIGAFTGVFHGFAQGVIGGLGQLLGGLVSKYGGEVAMQGGQYANASFGCFTAALGELGRFGGHVGRGLKVTKAYGDSAALLRLAFAEMVTFIRGSLGHNPGVVAYSKGHKVGVCMGQLIAAAYLEGIAAQIRAIDPPLPLGVAGVPTPLRSPLSADARSVDLPATPGEVRIPARADGEHLRLEGHLTLHLDGALPLPPGRLVADGLLIDPEGLVVDEGEIDLEVEAVHVGGAVTLDGPGRLGRYGEDAGAVFRALAATIDGSVTFVDAEGRPLTLLAEEATLESRGAVSLPARFAATADDAALWLGAEALAGFAGALAFDGGEVAIAGRASGRLGLVEPPPGLDLGRGDEGALALAAESTIAGAHEWRAEGPAGWEVTFADDGLRVRPAPGAPAGEHAVRVWIADAGQTLAAGVTVPVRLGAGEGGLGLALAHQPLFTFLTDFGPAPLVLRASLVNRDEAAVEVALAATAPEGFEAHLAAPSVTLAPGAHGEVHLDLVPVADPPPVGTPLRVRVHAGDVEAEAVVLTPPLLGVEVRLEPAELRLAPGDRAEQQLVLRPRGNSPDEVDLTVHTGGPLRLEGLPDRLRLVPGEPVSLPVVVTLGDDAVPGLGYVAGVTLHRGEMEVARVATGVRTHGREAGDALAVAAAAEESGRPDAARVLDSLAVRLDALRERCDAGTRSHLARELRVLAAELGDPVLADLGQRLRELSFVLDAVDVTPCEALAEAVLEPLRALLAELSPRLRAVHAHDFTVELAPSFALVAPGQPATFQITAARRGTEPVTLNLELLDLPGDAGGPLSPAPLAADHPIVVHPPGPGRHPFRVRVTAVEAPALTRTVTALVVVEGTPVEVVSLGADPPFALPGARLKPFVRLFNVANVPQDLHATVEIDRPDGSRLFTSAAPVAIRLNVAQSIQRFTLADVVTLGEPPGLYALRVAVRADPDGEPIAEGEAEIFVGQPLRAEVAAEPALLPPGDTEATVTIDARRRPPPSLPGVRAPTAIDLFTSTAAGPIGLAVTDDGTIYVSNFGQGRQIQEGSPGAGNTVSRITPAGQVSLFATVPEAPTDMVIGPDGALYVANAGNPERITRVELPGGAVSTYYDFRANPPPGGTNNPLGIAFDSRGALYAAELYDLVLFSFTQPGTKLFKVEPDGDGDGRGDSAATWSRSLSSPTRLVIDPRTDDLIVCDAGNRRVVRIATAPGIGTDPVPLVQNQDNPQGLAFDDNHNLYVLDHALGTVDVYPTAVVDGRTAIAGPGARWLDGLDTPITLVLAPDGAALTTARVDQQVLRIRTTPPEPSPAVVLAIEHRFVGDGAEPASFEGDVPVDGPAWDVDRVVWQAELAPEALAASFRYRHALPAMAPGERRPLTAGTTVRYRVGEAEAEVELPPIAAIADHLVGLEPDRLAVMRDAPVEATVLLSNHRDVPDTMTLAVEGLPSGVRAELAAQIEVPARGTARVPLRITAAPAAEDGLRRLVVRAESSFGAVDRVVGEIDVLGGLEVQLVPPERVVRWGEQVTFTARFTNRTPVSLFLDGATEGLSSVLDDPSVIAQPHQTREARISAFELRAGQTMERTLTVRPIGPPGSYAFRLRAFEFRNDRPAPSASAAGRLVVEAGRAVSLALDPPEISASPESARIGWAVLRNAGDVPARYHVTADRPSGWELLPEPGPHLLLPGETRRVPVRFAAGRQARNASFTLTATDADFAETRAQATGTLRVPAAAASIALEPADVLAQDGEARITVRLRRLTGNAVFALGVDGPITGDAVWSVPQIDLRIQAEGTATLTLRGLAGLAPGPWPVRVRAWPVGAEAMYTEALARVTVPGGGLRAVFEEEALALARPMPARTGLLVANGDFARAREVTVTFESAPEGLPAVAAPVTGTVPPGATVRFEAAIAPRAPGAWTLHATVRDGGDGEAAADLPVTVGIGAPPVIQAAHVEPPPVEGRPSVLRVEAADPDGDRLRFDADLDGDGVWDVVGAAVPVFPLLFRDDAELVLRVAAMDPHGNRAELDVPVRVENAPPSIRGEPGVEATEGDAYVYRPEVTDPGADEVELVLHGPAGASLDDGEVRWTPTFAQARAGTADFRLVARDDDGGEAEQRWTVRVRLRDLDGDGVPDTCEMRHGADPFHDSDGDGRSDLQECVRGSPIHGDGRPTAPRPVRPIDGEWIEAALELEVEAAFDPDGDPIGYVFQVRVGEEVVRESDPQPELVWAVEPPLPGGAYTWRALATDGAGDGPWSEDADFAYGRGDAVADAGPPDAETPDAAPPPDAAVPPPDLGAPGDAGPDADYDAWVEPDAAVPDVMVPDAGLPDAGLLDAGLLDAAPADGAHPDAARPDAAGRDARVPGDSDAAGDPSGAPADGCDCDTSGGGPTFPALLALAALLRRRRRARP